MDDATRQPLAGGANRPQLSFPLYLAAALAALAWPRLAPNAGLFARLGPDASAILWVPFALWAAAEGMLLLAPCGCIRRTGTGLLNQAGGSS